MSDHTDDFEPLFLVPIEPGEYPLCYLRHVFNHDGFKGSPKIEIDFQIARGKHAGREVTRFYNVDVITTQENGKPRKRWKAIRNGDLLIEFMDVCGDKLSGEKNLQLHNIPFAKYYGAFTVIGHVEYAKRNPKKLNAKKLVDPRTAEPIVRELLRIDEGDSSFSSLPNPSFLSSSTPPLVEGGAKADEQRVSEECVYQDDVEIPSKEVQVENAAVLDDWI